jgi:hypothetical protein
MRGGQLQRIELLGLLERRCGALEEIGELVAPLGA